MQTTVYFQESSIVHQSHTNFGAMATTLNLEREAAQNSLVWLTALVTVLVCCRSVAGNPANVTNVKCTNAARGSPPALLLKKGHFMSN